MKDADDGVDNTLPYSIFEFGVVLLVVLFIILAGCYVLRHHFRLHSLCLVRVLLCFSLARSDSAHALHARLSQVGDLVVVWLPAPCIQPRSRRLRSACTSMGRGQVPSPLCHDRTLFYRSR